MKDIIRNNLITFCEETYKISKVNINHIVRYTIEELVDDICSTIANDKYFQSFELEEDIAYKHQHFNACLFNNKRKYKIFLGLNSLSAQNNHNEMIQLFTHLYPHVNDIIEYTGNGFRVESHPYVPGIIFADVLTGLVDTPISIEQWDELFVEFVKNSVIDDNGMATFPIDIQPSNLLLSKNGEIMLIDYDHITTNIYPTIIDYIIEFYLKSYTNKHYTADIWLKYTNKYTYTSRVEHFKQILGYNDDR